MPLFFLKKKGKFLASCPPGLFYLRLLSICGDNTTNRVLYNCIRMTCHFSWRDPKAQWLFQEVAFDEIVFEVFEARVMIKSKINSL